MQIICAEKGYSKLKILLRKQTYSSYKNKR